MKKLILILVSNSVVIFATLLIDINHDNIMLLMSLKMGKSNSFVRKLYKYLNAFCWNHSFLMISILRDSQMSRYDQLNQNHNVH